MKTEKGESSQSETSKSDSLGSTSRTQRTLFSVASFYSSWRTPSDLWVLINPEQNGWLKKVDPSLNFLIRRTYTRFENRKGSRKSGEPLLIAPPAGHPARRVLLIDVAAENPTSQWIKTLDPLIRGLLGSKDSSSVTFFAPESWKAPSARSIIEARAASSSWELRWVE